MKSEVVGTAQLMNVPVSALVGEQVRQALNPERVQQYADRLQCGDHFPPLDVFRDGDGQLWLADGFHRKRAAIAAGLASFPALVRPGTQDDALWFALGANHTHGLGLTEHDKKHAITLALARWPERSTTMIAEQVGCSQSRVVQIKAEVSRATNLPHPSAPPARVLGKDGKSYPAKREPVWHRAEQIREQAESGRSTPQIAAALGVSEDRVRSISRTAQVAIPADTVMRKTRRIDPVRVITAIVEAAEHLVSEGVFIDWQRVPEEVTRAQVSEWVTSLRTSQRDLAKFIKRLERIAS